MLRLAILFLLLPFIFCQVVIAKDLEQQEIEFKENPTKLYAKLTKVTEFPLSFSTPQEFAKVADELGYKPEELHRNLEVLARLTLETNLQSSSKYEDAELLIKQLDAIDSTVFEQAMVIMLKARFKAKRDKQYQSVVVEYMEAFNKINSDLSLEATLFKYTLHEHLASLHIMLLQPAPALSHLNQYREIAYQLHNDYFIAESEAALGKYYNRSGDMSKSLLHFTEAFRLANGLNYLSLKSQTLLNLARTYRDLEQWDDALKYAHDATEILQKLGNESYLAETLNVIAMIYAAQEKWSKAIDYYLNSQQVNERLGNNISVALNFHNVGEVYSKLKNYPAAMNALKQANDIFRAHKTNHYLVHNELLFAQVSAEQQLWPETIDHAKKALELAKQKKLIDVQIEALGYLSKAYRSNNDLNAAIDSVEAIIALNQSVEDKKQANNSRSELTEQKLKFELTLLNNKLEQQATKNKRNQMIILSVLILMSIALITVVFLYRKLQYKTKQYQASQIINNLEPLSQSPGYRAFIQTLATMKQSEPKTLALVNINELNNIDMQLGLTESVTLMHSFMKQLNQHLGTDIFVIRSGVFACYFNQQRDADFIYEALLTCLQQFKDVKSSIPNFAQLQNIHQVSIGHINLPLLSNPDVNISAELHFETLQYALAAAMEMTEKPAYVSLRPLNFAPAAIFMPPLYLNLTQALNRGIIRAESNRNSLDINWPKC